MKHLAPSHPIWYHIYSPRRSAPWFSSCRLLTPGSDDDPWHCMSCSRCRPGVVCQRLIGKHLFEEERSSWALVDWQPSRRGISHSARFLFEGLATFLSLVLRFSNPAVIFFVPHTMQKLFRRKKKTTESSKKVFTTGVKALHSPESPDVEYVHLSAV